MSRQTLLLLTLVVVWPWLVASTRAAEPITLHPENPHYFLFRGKPAVLITSGEHYEIGRASCRERV